MKYEAQADRCFENWDGHNIVWRPDEKPLSGDHDEAVAPRASASDGALAVAECEPLATGAEWRLRAKRRTAAVAERRATPETRPMAAQRFVNAKPDGRRFGRWWLAGCLLLAALFGGGMFGGSRQERPVPVAARAPRSRTIETIRVGDRVVTRDAGAGGEWTETAVNPKTWKKLRLLAVTHWGDGTRDDIHVETLQPPEWIKQHDVRIGATVPLPLDLVEMGLPRDLCATVIAVEHCPEISDGPGRVVLTTVNHLNKYVFELTIKDAAGQSETVHTTGFHKFYSASRNAWISAAELRKGEQLRGVNGALTVAALAPLPGVHRVYNMTVEDEHVYRVGTLGTLVHNAGCYSQDQQALQELINEATNGGRKPLSVDDGNTILDWGQETGYPGIRAGPNDVGGLHGTGPHINVPGAGYNGHVPVSPGVAPRG